ncbi:MAG: BamA/TamA family outer membrane protein [Betaproteobacteria bacterium]
MPAPRQHHSRMFGLGLAFSRPALLVLALLAGAPASLLAQPSAAVGQGSEKPAAAFTLEIQAPPGLSELLTNHLELQRYRELTDLGDAELLRLMAAAEQDARSLAATLGYFAPDIHIQQVATETGQPRVVRLVVAPGPPTTVSDVRILFTGAIALDAVAQNQRQQIETSWPLRQGMRFTQAGWDAAKLLAVRQLTSQRYPRGQLSSSSADVDAETGSALLTITLDSGPAYHLGELRIEGLQRHPASLVQRLAQLDAGSDYALPQLMDAQQRLADSGYFDAVFLSLDTTGDPTAAPVRVQLRESQLQKLVLGLGASTDGGARMSAEHTHHQSPILGWRAVSKLSFDRETSSIGTDLTSPPDDKQTRWLMGGLLQTQHAGSFDASSQRLRFGRGQASEQIDRNYYLQYDRADTLSSDGNALVIAQTVSANYAYVERHLQGLPAPVSGWGLGVEFGGGSTLGADGRPFFRVLARGLAILPLGQGLTASPGSGARLSLRAETGALLADANANLPSTQLFLTGGDKTVRGYAYHDVGVAKSNGQTGPGRYLASGGLEWQQPLNLRGSNDWEGALFVDAGAVADVPADLKAKVGVGAGMRWKSPVGPLQLDLAYGVAIERWRLHLNVGFAF